MRSFYERRFDKWFKYLLENQDELAKMADQIVFSIERDLQDEMFGPEGEEAGDVTSGYGPKKGSEPAPKPEKPAGVGSRLGTFAMDVMDAGSDWYSSGRAAGNRNARFQNWEKYEARIKEIDAALAAKPSDYQRSQLEAEKREMEKRIRGLRARHVADAQKREKLATKDGDSWWGRLKKVGGRLFNTSRTYDGAMLNEEVVRFLDEAATPEVLRAVVTRYRSMIMNSLQQAYEMGQKDAQDAHAESGRSMLSRRGGGGGAKDYDPSGSGVGHRRPGPGSTIATEFEPNSDEQRVLSAMQKHGGDQKAARAELGMKPAPFSAALDALASASPEFEAWLAGDGPKPRKKDDQEAWAAHRSTVGDVPRIDPAERGSMLGR